MVSDRAGGLSASFGLDMGTQAARLQAQRFDAQVLDYQLDGQRGIDPNDSRVTRYPDSR